MSKPRLDAVSDGVIFNGMSRTRESEKIENGVNSSVAYGGREYHVQTQCSARDAPVIESLVFHGGETLVRITSSYEDVASRLGFTGDDGRHLLDLQHADLIHKIHHGMLRDDDSVAIDAARPEPCVPERRLPARARSPRRRWVLCIRLPF